MEDKIFHSRDLRIFLSLRIEIDVEFEKNKRYFFFLYSNEELIFRKVYRRWIDRNFYLQSENFLLPEIDIDDITI